MHWKAGYAESAVHTDHRHALPGVQECLSQWNALVGVWDLELLKLQMVLLVSNLNSI